MAPTGRTQPAPHGALDRLVTSFALSHGLSNQETAVLRLAAEGVHRKEAAFRLGCQAGTVDTYWRRIFRKTGWTDQSEIYAALLSFALGNDPGQTGPDK
jgi:DNA-binding NarL/FixJ family response regulator